MRIVFASFLATRLVALLLGIIIIGIGLAPGASAQRRAQWEYQPSRPTLSPYMNLLQTNFGPVPNYYSLVRPRLQQNAFNRQIEASERSRSLRIQSLEEGGVESRPISRTGKAGGFMEYLHYYPPPRSRSRR